MITTDTENKKNNILAQAVQLFSQKGYEGVSVREIAEASDCNLAAISYYFGGKEKLYEVCANLISPDEVNDVCISLTAPKSREDFTQKVALFSKDLCRLIRKHSKVIRIHINRFNAQEQFVTDLDETVLGPTYKSVRNFLNEGEKLSIVRKNINDRFQSRTLVSIILSEVIYHGVGSTDEELENFSQELAKSFTNAVS